MKAGFAFLACIAIADTAPAATHVACVGSADDLTHALSVLSSSPDNTDGDGIRIRTGTYFAPVCP